MAFRTLRPTTAEEIRPHLYKVDRVFPDVSWRGVYLVGFDGWDGRYWFRTDRAMRGEHARLVKHAAGSIALCRTDALGPYGAISLNDDHSAERVAFNFPTDKGREPFDVAAEGIHRYLNGHDKDLSARIEATSRAEWQQHQRQLYEASETMKNQL